MCKSGNNEGSNTSKEVTRAWVKKSVFEVRRPRGQIPGL